MKLLSRTGRDDIATLYVAKLASGKFVEFAESVHPPRRSDFDKLVYIVSTMHGCPVSCKFCDAGGFYSGKLSADDIFAQIDCMAQKRFGADAINVRRWKVQFSRMGEPAFNDAVLSVLEQLPTRYGKTCIPSLSSVAPQGTEAFFEQLLGIKKRLYDDNFQLQFSIHSTDMSYRDWLIPVKKWPFEKIAAYAERFYSPGGKKVTLNFAYSAQTEIAPPVLLRYFDTGKFLIKITPVNPTGKAASNNIESGIIPGVNDYPVIREIEAAGYQVILSVGDLEENAIGSNCGQYVTTLLREGKPAGDTAVCLN